MRIVIAPDKFKGSLSATRVAAAIAAGLRAEWPAAELISIPVADGGDGTVDAAVAGQLDDQQGLEGHAPTLSLGTASWRAPAEAD